MKKIFGCVLIILIISAMFLSVSADGALLAFPGAEGGGKFSPGARSVLSGGGTVEVYHVTNLNASGKGSFADAVSESGRIIVFDVGGTINVGSGFRIRKSGLTILGQTAPGDGITISGSDVIFDDGVSDIIMRYLKVRPTDKNGGEPDGLGGRFNSNVIIDHCSTSWCVDELLTLYAGPAEDGKPVGNHLTIQNTIGSESLRMSNHVKGAHGYGAIWGGSTASYVNNLLAHHDSRSPRMDRQLQNTDVTNNVIYNWGQTNSAYGAEPYSNDKSMKIPCRINWIGNYYKYGPSTRSSLRNRIFDVASPMSSGDPKSQFYFSENYINGNKTGTANINNAAGAELLTAEVDMGEYAINDKTAEEAYNYVLENAGATLPRRDAIDARIINDVKNNTGRVINNASEVGGLIPVPEVHKAFEIPSGWLNEKGYAGRTETDITDSGYTVIEEYVNEWTEEQPTNPPTNPNIIVQSPATASVTNKINGLSVDNGNWTVISENESVNYKATAFAVGGNDVTKMELYDKNSLIGTFEASEINTTVPLSAGTHYLTSRAYNTRGDG